VLLIVARMEDLRAIVERRAETVLTNLGAVLRHIRTHMQSRYVTPEPPWDCAALEHQEAGRFGGADKQYIERVWEACEGMDAEDFRERLDRCMSDIRHPRKSRGTKRRRDKMETLLSKTTDNADGLESGASSTWWGDMAIDDFGDSAWD
jgi:hypothetical protein